jgi:hypothetical protein
MKVSDYLMKIHFMQPVSAANDFAPGTGVGSR